MCNLVCLRAQIYACSVKCEGLKSAWCKPWVESNWSAHFKHMCVCNGTCAARVLHCIAPCVLHAGTPHAGTPFKR